MDEEKMTKLGGYDFYNSVLGAPKYIVAPMVDQSELAWRMLSKNHGAQLCYTPMFHALNFVKDAHYRKEALQTCDDDRPLIIQFCANDPAIFLKAAQLAEPYCDAIDLNLGCPQTIAKRGHYGAFLQDEWDLLTALVSTCHKNLKIPITCKIRIYPEIDKTVKYAKMLEAAGCQLLTVHGRIKEQKGINTGLASWSHIKAVKESLKIPVFANGNIQYLEDVHKCKKETGVDGVMSAEGNLHNPALFEGRLPVTYEMAEEYLELAKKYPCPLSYARGHIFKIFHHVFQIHKDLRELVAVAKDLSDLENATLKTKERLQEVVKSHEDGKISEEGSHLPHPYWLCQPYVRPKPGSNAENSKDRTEKLKRAMEEAPLTESGQKLSKNQLKKLKRNPNKAFDGKSSQEYIICMTCKNPKGAKCKFNLCRQCCKKHSLSKTLDCTGHNFLFKTKSESKKSVVDSSQSTTVDIRS